jgi:hypothetical protein
MPEMRVRSLALHLLIEERDLEADGLTDARLRGETGVRTAASLTRVIYVPKGVISDRRAPMMRPWGEGRHPD